MRTLIAVLLLAAGPLDELAQARDAMRRLDYPEALRHLAAAEQQPDLGPAQVAELYELQGVANATLKKKEAVDSFRKLLALVPDHKFDAARAPRVMTPYYEARDWVKQRGALLVKAAPTRDGEKLTVELRLNDPLGLAHGLSVGLNEDGATRELTFKTAALPALITSTALNAELAVTVLGAKGQRLQVKVLRFERPPAEPPAPPTPPPALTAAEPRPPPSPAITPIERRPEPPFFTGRRITAVALLGFSVVALAAGASLGWQSHEGRQRFQSALDGVMPLTRDDAVALSDQVQKKAIIADTLFGLGGALALTGLLLFILGGPQ